MRNLLSLPLALLAVAAACADAPTGAATSGEQAQLPDAVVFTWGDPAPASRMAPTSPRLSDLAVGANLGGSTSTPLTLKANTCSGSSQQVTATFTITGRQDNPASFKVYSTWTYNGTTWSGSDEVTVNVPPRPTGPGSTVREVTLNVSNGSTASSGTSVLFVAPFGLVTSAPAALGIVLPDDRITVNVEFAGCTVPNTPPTLVLPADMTGVDAIEATSAAGATVNFVVTANDAEDDAAGIALNVTCTPASGSTFALGTTTVNCEVTDAGGLKATGSFLVEVVDTTPAYFTSFPTALVQLVAADISGATLDISTLGITVADVGLVSEPSTFSCDYVAGTKLGIGSTTAVTCKAKDNIGNEMPVGSSFNVFVGLNVNASGFLTPLRMVAPFSGHKLGSTIPHKFLAPTYADGTPATDLASGLALSIRKLDPTPDVISTDVSDFTAGSTTWRYDELAGQYIFNAKTGTTTPWGPGTWQTTASYKGIELATTKLEIRK